jgi:hypothetical protein
MLVRQTAYKPIRLIFTRQLDKIRRHPLVSYTRTFSLIIARITIALLDDAA